MTVGKEACSTTYCLFVLSLGNYYILSTTQAAYSLLFVEMQTLKLEEYDVKAQKGVGNAVCFLQSLLSTRGERRRQRDQGHRHSMLIG
jgi:hypothetical protein